MSYDHYNKTIGGVKADVYRICDLYGVTEPAIFQSIKKLLRCGSAHKGIVQDVVEARDGLNRWLEMQSENRDSAEQRYVDQVCDHREAGLRG